MFKKVIFSVEVEHLIRYVKQFNVYLYKYEKILEFLMLCVVRTISAYRVILQFVQTCRIKRMYKHTCSSTRTSTHLNA